MPLYQAIHIATLTLTAWFAYKGRRPFPLFLPFMMMVVFVEAGFADWFYDQYDNKYPVLNPYAKLCMYYYLFVFFWHFKDKPWANKIKWGILFFAIVTMTYNFLYHDHTRIDLLSYNAGFLLLFPLMFRYLYEVIYTRPYYNVFEDPYFYFIFGLLLFYTSSFPILGFINILITDNPQYPVYSQLLNLGNIFLSLAYLGAALCSKPRTLSTVSS
jgi:hypothetical protein